MEKGNASHGHPLGIALPVDLHRDRTSFILSLLPRGRTHGTLHFVAMAFRAVMMLWGGILLRAPALLRLGIRFSPLYVGLGLMDRFDRIESG
jgi:hypothetical protein